MSTIDFDLAALEALNIADSRTLFDAVDKLSSLGLGRIVDLPQIILVGDQSSGKSSVLEAISKVHFPSADRVCTRFATELSLRPGNSRSVKATVHFADGRTPEEPLRVEDFKEDDMERIIRDAKEKMGLSSDERNFSKDKLRLEIEGPNLHRLTLVDLPGIFHAETAQQSTEGMTTVNELVDSYMKKPDCIILAIVSAETSVANQAVMQKARTHDPNRTRTLGILTKPDRLDQDSTSEQNYLQIVRGHEPVHKLGLGWHVLRNLAENQRDLGSRDTVEAEFLASGNWASLADSSRGVAELRNKLGLILHGHIKKGLPAMIETIQAELSKRQEKKNRLGSTRSTMEEMRAYLINISANFQDLVRDDIRGHYNDPLLRELASKQENLRSQLRNLNRGLRHVLLVIGATQVVSDRLGQSLTPSSLKPPGYLKDFLRSCAYTEGLPRPQRITAADLSARLERQTAANQGMQFPGTANTDVMVSFFQDQIKPWTPIAERHLEKVMTASETFVKAVLEHVVGPLSSNNTAQAIMSKYVVAFFNDKEDVLKAKLQELLRPYKEGYAVPLDYDFHREMITRRAEATAIRRGSSVGSEDEDYEGTPPNEHSEFGTGEMIESVMTFYDMSLRTFTENIINLAVEGCLIQDLPSIFTPQLVNSLSPTQVEELAAESEEVRHSRSQLERDIELLEEGLRKCRPFRFRAALHASPPVTRTPEETRESLQSPVSVEDHSDDAHEEISRRTSSPQSIHETNPAPQSTSTSTALPPTTQGTESLRPTRREPITVNGTPRQSLFGDLNPTRPISQSPFSVSTLAEPSNGVTNTRPQQSETNTQNTIRNPFSSEPAATEPPGPIERPEPTLFNLFTPSDGNPRVFGQGPKSLPKSTSGQKQSGGPRKYKR